MSPQPRTLVHFLLLSEAEKIVTIRRMYANGWSLEGIRAATKISVEQLRIIIGKPQ